MRVFAIVLVVLGCLGLGQYGFRKAGGNPAAKAPDVPPAVSGIAVAGGLLLLTTGTRRSA